MKKLLILSLAAAMTLPAFAQKKKEVWPNKDSKRWMLGVHGGTTVLVGDAQKFGFGYVAGLRVNYSFSHAISLRVSGNYGQVKGEELTDNRPFTSYKFTNNFWETQVQGIVTLGNISYLRKARKTNFYIGGGMGLMGNDATSTFVLKSDLTGTEQTGTFTEMTPSFSGVGGMRYSLNPNIALGLEYNFRYCGSDLIDVLQYESSGNKSKDAISMVSVTVDFKLGKKGKEHVEWINPVEAIYEDIAKVEKKVEALSGDQDGDGVADYFDKDNTTPQGAMVYGNGQA
ncbi:MAG: PorT family protein, partial [Bacteroidota bacterium]|nr:PorT family protein [Bacteroidota bacterium]MDX5431152.1 PorT family protein [Bacteroidota bacterium]MDX5469899.1 PorT family protein [Bacteroidota bacterium]